MTLTEIHPKLPMRSRAATMQFYQQMGFVKVGGDYDEYLMVKRDSIEIHFFLHQDLKPDDNYGQVYIRTDYIDDLYQSFLRAGVPIHPAGHLMQKPWGQREFSILDPDKNLLTFGQSV